jgi:hypothetical protein
MKFYRYPLAIVAYALLAIFVLVLMWHRLGHSAMEHYWYYFPEGAGCYLAIAFVLSKLNIQWEWDTAIQVGFVLIPVLVYVNIKEPYHRPVYIFMVRSDYKGKLTVNFDLSKNAQTNANRLDDTLYFRFDEHGEIMLNEEVAYIKKSMRNNLFLFYPNSSRKLVPFADIKKLPTDTTQKVLVEDSVELDNGRMKVMHFRLDFPQRLK